MDSRNQLDLFKNTVNHKKIGKHLYYADFTPDLEKRVRQRFNLNDSDNLRSFFGMYNPVTVGLKPPGDVSKPDFSRYYAGAEVPGDAYIDSIGVLHIPGSMYHFTRYVSPLRNAGSFEDIESFPYYDYSRYFDDGMEAQVGSAHSFGRVAECWVGHMYEDAWQIRGYEQFLEDMVFRPEWCGYILDRIKEKNKTAAIAAAHAGVDIIRTGDDVANQKALMFSPAMWRSMMKPRWAEVYEAARSIKPDIQIWYHSDGNIEEIIPDFIEIGVTVLNPIQPECMDPVIIKKRYGDRIVLDGTIGTQTVMPFGTPQDVKKVVGKYVELLGYDGALILAPTHVLEPEVPMENILAFVEAAGN